jgi:ubiquitin conjugation factor E4 B
MLNLQSLLYKFADPFIDATFSKVGPPLSSYLLWLIVSFKMDRVDPLFYINSDRIDLGDETRIKATSEEAAEWAKSNRDPNGEVSICPECRLINKIDWIAPVPNFISNIFYLCVGMSHYGYLKTVDSYNQLSRHADDTQRHLDSIEQERSWVGVNLIALSRWRFFSVIHSRHLNKVA